MWTLIDSSIFGNLVPVETYLYYDGPLSFSINNKDRWFYVHAHDFNQKYCDYIAREVTIEELKLLEENKITIKKFLENATVLYLIRDNFGSSDKKLETFEAKDFSNFNFAMSDGVYLLSDKKEDNG